VARTAEPLTIVAYQLINEDLTNLGGPMGTEYTTERWRRNYKTLPEARAAAERDYGEPIEWKGYSSGDLGHVMYTIQPVRV